MKTIPLPLVAFALLLGCALPARAGERYQPPASPRQRLDFNIGWKFIRQDVAGAAAPDFDDRGWQTVSTLTPGTITLTARRDGLATAKVEIVSTPTADVAR